MMIISMFFYKIAMGKSILDLNMVTLSFWILGSFTFLPSLVVLLELPILIDHDFWSTKLIYGDFSNKFNAWLIQYWLMIGIPFGAILGRLVITQTHNVKANIIKYDYFDWSSSSKVSNDVLFYSCYIFLIVYLILLILFIDSNNPLFVLLNGGGFVEIMIARNSFSGFDNFVLSFFYNQEVLIIFSLITYGVLLKLNLNKWKVLFYLYFISVCSFSILIGSSGSILFYFISLTMMRYFILGKFINKYFILPIVLSIFLMFLFFKTSDETTVVQLFEQILTRVFFDQSKGFYYALQIFPEVNPFIGFSSSAVWLNELLSGTSSLDYGHILMENYNLQGVIGGTSGHFTSIFVTEMYSNFGYLGVLIGPIWAGVVIYCVHHLFMAGEQTIILRAFYTYIAIFGFGYFSDFVRFYYPVNILKMLFSTLIQLFIITRIVNLIPKKSSNYEIKN